MRRLAVLLLVLVATTMFADTSGATTEAFVTSAVSGGAQPPVEQVGYEDVLMSLPEASEGSQVIPDEGRGHVFVTTNTKLLVVSTHDSGPVRSVPGALGGQAIWMPGKRELAMTLIRLHRVDIIDAVNLRVSKHLPLPANICPLDPVAASGLIFFSYDECTSGNPDDDFDYTGVGAVDPISGHVTLGLERVNSFSPIRLTAVPSQDALIASYASFPTSTDNTTVYDTTGGASPRLTARAARDSYIRGAVSPDGTQFVSASTETENGENVGMPIYSTRDLGLIGHCDTSEEGYSSQPEALAFRADGRLMVVMDRGTTDLMFFDPSDPSRRVRAIDYGEPGNPGDSREFNDVATAAWGAVDGYTITYDVYGDYAKLRRVRSGPATPMSLTTSAGRYSYGRTATATIRLRTHTLYRQVRLYLTEVGHDRRLVARGPLDSQGRFTAHIPVRRTGTFLAVFDGDSHHESGLATEHIGVNARISMSIPTKHHRNGWAITRWNSHPPIQVHVTGANPTGCVTMRLQRLNRGVWSATRTFDCLVPNKQGNIRTRMPHIYPAQKPVRVSVRYAGTDVNGPSQWAFAKVRFVR